MRALCPTNKLRVVDHDPPGLGPSPVLATKIQLKTTSRLRMRRLCKPSSDLIWRRVAGSHLTIRRNGHLQELRLSHPMVGMGASQAVRLCLKLADTGMAGLRNRNAKPDIRCMMRVATANVESGQATGRSFQVRTGRRSLRPKRLAPRTSRLLLGRDARGRGKAIPVHRPGPVGSG
jgi:hypothetical protein